MGCNCGKKRLMNATTSANLTAGSIAPDRPDIAEAKAAAEARVAAARQEIQTTQDNAA